ncbi:hypothetical protein SDC9_91581 [bioreactor metagenome]|uniref:Uncharacterized protein n=1 Tax=bioreactor metagenome TaxID=1076179 RepID=A0A644ZV83_9ZZZZ
MRAGFARAVEVADAAAAQRGVLAVGAHVGLVVPAALALGGLGGLDLDGERVARLHVHLGDDERELEVGAQRGEQLVVFRRGGEGDLGL